MLPNLKGHLHSDLQLDLPKRLRSSPPSRDRPLPIFCEKNELKVLGRMLLKELHVGASVDIL